MNKYLNINKGILLIEGSKGGLIINFLNGKFYHTKKEIIEFLNYVGFNRIKYYQIMNKNKYKKIIENNNLINYLINEKIIEFNEEKKIPIKFDELDYDTNYIYKLEIEINNICNQKCKHCYYHNFKGIIKEFDFDKFKKIIEQLKYYGLQNLLILGGEPLLSKELLINMISYSYNFENLQYIVVFTNCYMLDFEFLNSISKYKDKIIFNFVLHSYNEKDHDEISQIKGSFKKTINAIDLCKSLGFYYNLASIISKYNYKNLESENKVFFDNFKCEYFEEMYNMFSIARDYSKNKKKIIHDINLLNNSDNSYGEKYKEAFFGILSIILNIKK